MVQWVSGGGGGGGAQRGNEALQQYRLWGDVLQVIPRVLYQLPCHVEDVKETPGNPYTCGSEVNILKQVWKVRNRDKTANNENFVTMFLVRCLGRLTQKERND